MSVTSIQFIGLFVVMMNGGAGLHILLPHFPGTPYAGHTSVIQYSPDEVTSATWPGVTSCGPSDTLRCAPINLETITFSGATDPAPVDIIGAISHLSCCCASMTDILPQYMDPSASGKVSAHIFVDLGIAEAIAANNGRVDTWVTMHSVDPIGITVTANAGTTGSFNIVFNPGAQITILNSMTSTDPTPNHFLAYYLMGNGSGCTAVPTGGLPCAASECSIASNRNVQAVKPLVSVKQSVQATNSSVSTKQSGKTTKPSVGKKRKRTRHVHANILDLTADCSNSHFP